MTVPVAPRLPINRKERYYTGTVLPMIVACDRFAHLHRLLELCDLAGVAVDEPRLDTLQFFTEYSFAESVILKSDLEEFADRPSGGDTPDLVIVGPDWLVAAEAKMFHNPDATALSDQVNRQAKLVAYWTSHFGLSPSRVAHVLLLPQGLVGRLHNARLPVQVVTWERIVTTYMDVAPPYWLDVLRAALAKYDDLVTKTAWGKYKDGTMTGAQIVAARNNGDNTYTWMGRDRGLNGKPLDDDLASGKWITRKYEVRIHPLPTNGNWFAITDFVTRVAMHAATSPPSAAQ